MTKQLLHFWQISALTPIRIELAQTWLPDYKDRTSEYTASYLFLDGRLTLCCSDVWAGLHHEHWPWITAQGVTTWNLWPLVNSVIGGILCLPSPLAAGWSLPSRLTDLWPAGICGRCPWSHWNLFWISETEQSKHHRLDKYYYISIFEINMPDVSQQITQWETKS